jgi:hypothetical protein
MIEVFKAASEKWLLFPHPKIPAHSKEHGSTLICKAFSNIIQAMDMIYFTMEGIVLSRCRHTARHLGGYIIHMNITSNMQVPCHCKHAPRHLGANASFFFNHHIVNRPSYLKEMSWPYIIF